MKKSKGPPARLLESDGPDLTRVNRDLVSRLNGESIEACAAATLATGERIRDYWEQLEPVVKELIVEVRRHVEDPSGEWRASAVVTTSLLATVTSVVEKMSKASEAMLRASGGQARLATMLRGGVPERPDAAKMSEKQLANVVIETARKIVAEMGKCPFCNPPPPAVEVLSS